LLLGGEGVGSRRDSGCEEITDEPTGCGLCGKEGGEDCESEGHSDDRVIIELQMDVIYRSPLYYKISFRQTWDL
jgi:hypothetical protein